MNDDEKFGYDGDTIEQHNQYIKSKIEEMSKLISQNISTSDDNWCSGRDEWRIDYGDSTKWPTNTPTTSPYPTTGISPGTTWPYRDATAQRSSQEIINSEIMLSLSKLLERVMKLEETLEEQRQLNELTTTPKHNKDDLNAADAYEVYLEAMENLKAAARAYEIILDIEQANK